MRISHLLGVFIVALYANTAFATLFINEVDSNQAGLDNAEFVELYDGGVGETSLDGHLLVFFNGNRDTAYLVLNLDGESTDEAGFFVVGNAGVRVRPDRIIPDNTIQNGPDAIALYDAGEADYLPGEPFALSSSGLLAAVVYGNAAEPDAELLALLDPAQPQLDENANAAAEEHSLQRCPSDFLGPLQTGGFGVALPTPGAPNSCPQAPARVVINEVDADQSALDTREFVELYDGGAGKTPLDGLVLVFYNGAVNTAYYSFDLDGAATDSDGYFLLGSFDVGPDIVLPDGQIQNGPDAVALYVGDASEFPAGTPPATENLLDAVVYTTGAAEDSPLLVLVGGVGPILVEGGAEDADTQSLQRCPNGEGLPLSLSPFASATPTPRAVNTCAIDLPIAGFNTVPLQVFAGDPVDVANTSTGIIDTYLWTFEGGSPGTSSDAAPTGIVFANTGTAKVSLEVSGPAGADIETMELVVLDPAPSAAGITISKEQPAPCDEVQLAALHPGGRPPLSYLWSISDGEGQEIFTAEGSSITWGIPADALSGAYTATLTISNDKGEFSVAEPIGVAAIRPGIELSTVQPLITRLPQAAFDIAVDSSDAMSGFGGDDLLLTNATLLALEGADNLYSAIVAFTAEGPATMQVREGAGVIRCGIPSTASNVLAFTHDPTPPAATLSSTAPPVFEESGFFVDVAFTEPVTGLEESDFVIGNGVVGNLTGEGDAYVLTVIAATPGQVTVSLASNAVLDAAQNTNAAVGPLVRAYLTESTLFTHSADTNEDGVISLSELLRLVQLYNASSFQCDEASEDGYALGESDRTCDPHSSDYLTQDWVISLSEILRAVQMYAAGAYYACDSNAAEDGYCLGDFSVL